MARSQARTPSLSVRGLVGWWLLVGAMLTSPGCSHTVAVGARVLEPAAVPVRAFPEIWVVGGYLDEDEEVLSRLTEALQRDGKHRVVRVDLDQLEPLRRAGKIPTASVVVVVEVRILEGTRQSIDTVPVRVCGSFGCDTQYRQVTSDVPWVRGVAILQVHEGSSARLLQRHVVRTDQYGGDPFAQRAEVARQLAADVAAAVEVRERSIEVRFFEVDVPQVQAAQARIAAGDWAAGRALLERAVGSAQVRALSPEARARVFYDLGLARRFAPTGEDFEQGFDLAERALQQAAQLDPEERAYEVALRALADQRAAYGQLIAQREAQERNFALQTEGATVPSPPASYQTPASPPGPTPIIPPAPSQGAPTSGQPADVPESSSPAQPSEQDFEPR